MSEDNELPYFTRLYQEAFQQPWHSESRHSEPVCDIRPVPTSRSSTGRIESSRIDGQRGDATRHSTDPHPNRSGHITDPHPNRSGHTTDPHLNRSGHTTDPHSNRSGHNTETTQQRIPTTRSHRPSSDYGTNAAPEAEKRFLLEEIEKYKNLYELKSLVEAQKDEDIQLLQHQLESARRVAGGHAMPPPPSRQSDKGWDLTGLLRESARNWTGRSNSAGTDGSVAGGGGSSAHTARDVEIQKLRDSLEARGKHIAQLQDQLTKMENYLNKEREAFQIEVDQRNKKIQELKGCLEREKDVSANILQHKVELIKQVEQKACEIERRENWIKDLTARVNRQEGQITRLESELVQRRYEYEKAQQQIKRHQTKLDMYESSFQNFSCYQVNLFNRLPVTLSLYKVPQTNAHYFCVQRWDSRLVLRSENILSVTIANIATTSIGKWSFRGVSGRIMEWWGSDLIFLDQNSEKTKRAAFWGNYSFDQITASGGTRVLVVETSSSGKLAFAFEDESGVDECCDAFQSFLSKRVTFLGCRR
eukprot:Blabericola_migrator_1__10104@NODE_560_length_7594_cov_42_214694_g420_i0_p2_GENE_NODE_560_length_7594_cov_42_214694_g420_i0NODE_560_length_7594_cov_42_214694_g420_i0_p2_ORF_typecomplete_len532_score79_59AAA_13/PF13166_6/2_4e03AAA_13/PF13166_6/9_2e06Golgin_A5/PF09787_9/1_1e03Golgin_A5/PF09787_9/2_9e05WEMBL/PF05701_11/0_0014HrpB7/PF09486_10/0_023HAP1_N/PF04849_13/3_2e03HAP1_N/PF04849_13/0_0026DUF3552/PF12072_8/20DUF3552/PF12072_8/0_0037Bacillus_HBL/PF05791_11/1_5e03Bacillus_HBL/PF05791_11/0_0037Ba